MPDPRIRAAVAFEAARLMYSRSESEYFTAKLKAAKRLFRGDIKPSDLPSNAEIREQVQTFARLHEGEKRTENLRDMRVHALKLMRRLCRFRPRLIGSVLTGHTRQGSDIDLHLFYDSLDPILQVIEDDDLRYDVEYKTITKYGTTRTYRHIHVYDIYTYELTVYGEDEAHVVFKSSITGKAIERASIAELEQLLRAEYPGFDPDAALEEVEQSGDPYPIFRLLLTPLEAVKQGAKHHPEGDALYHSLQVFERARDASPYDEEFLLAALLHDIGKAIDRHDHVTAGLEALEGFITERTHFLIAHHMDAHELRAGTLGRRQRAKLESHPDYDDLMLLNQCDLDGRKPGAVVCTIDEALVMPAAMRSIDSSKATSTSKVRRDVSASSYTCRTWPVIGRPGKA